MKFLISVFLLSFSVAHASELAIGPYLKMQEALAADDFQGSLAAHKAICAKEQPVLLKDGYKDCPKIFKSISELRESFKKMSEIYIAKGSKSEMKTFIKATCPMADNAKWIQTKGPLRNPYYGKSMLECGEQILK